jgi:hypothetical protein
MGSLRGPTEAGITATYMNVRRVVADGVLVEQHDVHLAGANGVTDVKGLNLLGVTPHSPQSDRQVSSWAINDRICQFPAPPQCY